MTMHRIMLAVIIIQVIAGYAGKIISMGEVYGIMTVLFLYATGLEWLIYYLDRKKSMSRR